MSYLMSILSTVLQGRFCAPAMACWHKCAQCSLQCQRRPPPNSQFQLKPESQLGHAAIESALTPYVCRMCIYRYSPTQRALECPPLAYCRTAFGAQRLPQSRLRFRQFLYAFCRSLRLAQHSPKGHRPCAHSQRQWRQSHQHDLTTIFHPCGMLRLPRPTVDRGL